MIQAKTIESGEGDAQKPVSLPAAKHLRSVREEPSFPNIHHQDGTETNPITSSERILEPFASSHCRGFINPNIPDIGTGKESISVRKKQALDFLIPLEPLVAKELEKHAMARKKREVKVVQRKEGMTREQKTVETIIEIKIRFWFLRAHKVNDYNERFPLLNLSNHQATTFFDGFNTWWHVPFTAGRMPPDHEAEAKSLCQQYQSILESLDDPNNEQLRRAVEENIEKECREECRD